MIAGANRNDCFKPRFNPEKLEALFEAKCASPRGGNQACVFVEQNLIELFAAYGTSGPSCEQLSFRLRSIPSCCLAGYIDFLGLDSFLVDHSKCRGLDLSSKCEQSDWSDDMNCVAARIQDPQVCRVTSNGNGDSVRLFENLDQARCALDEPDCVPKDKLCGGFSENDCDFGGLCSWNAGMNSCEIAECTPGLGFSASERQWCGTISSFRTIARLSRCSFLPSEGCVDMVDMKAETLAENATVLEEIFGRIQDNVVEGKANMKELKRRVEQSGNLFSVAFKKSQRVKVTLSEEESSDEETEFFDIQLGCSDQDCEDQEVSVETRLRLKANSVIRNRGILRVKSEMTLEDDLTIEEGGVLQIAGGRLVAASQGVAQIAVRGSVEFSNDTEVDTLVVERNGRGTLGKGMLRLRPGSKLQIGDSGVFTVSDGGVLDGEGGSTIENDGEFEFISDNSNGKAHVKVPLVNKRRMLLKRGAMTLEQGVQNSGTLSVERGASLRLGGLSTFSRNETDPSQLVEIDGQLVGTKGASITFEQHSRTKDITLRDSATVKFSQGSHKLGSPKLLTLAQYEGLGLGEIYGPYEDYKSEHQEALEEERRSRFESWADVLVEEQWPGYEEEAVIQALEQLGYTGELVAEFAPTSAMAWFIWAEDVCSAELETDTIEGAVVGSKIMEWFPDLQYEIPPNQYDVALDCAVAVSAWRHFQEAEAESVSSYIEWLSNRSYCVDFPLYVDCIPESISSSTSWPSLKDLTLGRIFEKHVKTALHAARGSSVEFGDDTDITFNDDASIEGTLQLGKGARIRSKGKVVDLSTPKGSSATASINGRIVAEGDDSVVQLDAFSTTGTGQVVPRSGAKVQINRRKEAGCDSMRPECVSTIGAWLSGTIDEIDTLRGVAFQWDLEEAEVMLVEGRDFTNEVPYKHARALFDQDTGELGLDEDHFPELAEVVSSLGGEASDFFDAIRWLARFSRQVGRCRQLIGTSELTVNTISDWIDARVMSPSEMDLVDAMEDPSPKQVWEAVDKCGHIHRALVVLIKRGAMKRLSDEGISPFHDPHALFNVTVSHLGWLASVLANDADLELAQEIEEDSRLLANSELSLSGLGQALAMLEMGRRVQPGLRGEAGAHVQIGSGALLKFKGSSDIDGRLETKPGSELTIEPLSKLRLSRSTSENEEFDDASPHSSKLDGLLIVHPSAEVEADSLDLGENGALQGLDCKMKLQRPVGNYKGFAHRFGRHNSTGEGAAARILAQYKVDVEKAIRQNRTEDSETPEVLLTEDLVAEEINKRGMELAENATLSQMVTWLGKRIVEETSCRNFLMLSTSEPLSEELFLSSIQNVVGSDFTDQEGWLPKCSKLSKAVRWLRQYGLLKKVEVEGEGSGWKWAIAWAKVKEVMKRKGMEWDDAQEWNDDRTQEFLVWLGGVLRAMEEEDMGKPGVQLRGRESELRLEGSTKVLVEGLTRVSEGKMSVDEDARVSIGRNSKLELLSGGRSQGDDGEMSGEDGSRRAAHSIGGFLGLEDKESELVSDSLGTEAGGQVSGRGKVSLLATSEAEEEDGTGGDGKGSGFQHRLGSGKVDSSSEDMMDRMRKLREAHFESEAREALFRGMSKAGDAEEEDDDTKSLADVDVGADAVRAALESNGWSSEDLADNGLSTLHGKLALWKDRLERCRRWLGVGASDAVDATSIAEKYLSEFGMSWSQEGSGEDVKPLEVACGHVHAAVSWLRQYGLLKKVEVEGEGSGWKWAIAWAKVKEVMKRKGMEWDDAQEWNDDRTQEFLVWLGGVLRAMEEEDMGKPGVQLRGRESELRLEGSTKVLVEGLTRVSEGKMSVDEDARVSIGRNSKLELLSGGRSQGDDGEMSGEDGSRRAAHSIGGFLGLEDKESELVSDSLGTEAGGQVSGRGKVSLLATSEAEEEDGTGGDGKGSGFQHRLGSGKVDSSSEDMMDRMRKLREAHFESEAREALFRGMSKAGDAEEEDDDTKSLADVDVGADAVRAALESNGWSSEDLADNGLPTLHGKLALWKDRLERCRRWLGVGASDAVDATSIAEKYLSEFGMSWSQEGSGEDVKPLEVACGHVHAAVSWLRQYGLLKKVEVEGEGSGWKWAIAWAKVKEVMKRKGMEWDDAQEWNDDRTQEFLVWLGGVLRAMEEEDMGKPGVQLRGRESELRLEGSTKVLVEGLTRVSEGKMSVDEDARVSIGRNSKLELLSGGRSQGDDGEMSGEDGSRRAAHSIGGFLGLEDKESELVSDSLGTEAGGQVSGRGKVSLLATSEAEEEDGTGGDGKGSGFQHRLGSGKVDSSSEDMMDRMRKLREAHFESEAREALFRGMSKAGDAEEEDDDTKSLADVDVGADAVRAALESNGWSSEDLADNGLSTLHGKLALWKDRLERCRRWLGVGASDAVDATSIAEKYLSEFGMSWSQEGSGEDVKPLEVACGHVHAAVSWLRQYGLLKKVEVEGEGSGWKWAIAWAKVKEVMKRKGMEWDDAQEWNDDRTQEFLVWLGGVLRAMEEEDMGKPGVQLRGRESELRLEGSTKVLMEGLTRVSEGKMSMDDASTMRITDGGEFHTVTEEETEVHGTLDFSRNSRGMLSRLKVGASGILNAGASELTFPGRQSCETGWCHTVEAGNSAADREARRSKWKSVRENSAIDRFLRHFANHPLVKGSLGSDIDIWDPSSREQLATLALQAMFGFSGDQLDSLATVPGRVISHLARALRARKLCAFVHGVSAEEDMDMGTVEEVVGESPFADEPTAASDSEFFGNLEKCRQLALVEMVRRHMNYTQGIGEETIKSLWKTFYSNTELPKEGDMIDMPAAIHALADSVEKEDEDRSSRAGLFVPPEGGVTVPSFSNLRLNGHARIAGLLKVEADSEISFASPQASSSLSRAFGGPLPVDGSIDESAIGGAIEAWGRVTGSGFIEVDSFEVRGEVAPGTASQPLQEEELARRLGSASTFGEFVYSGDLVFAAGSTLTMEIGGTSSGEYDSVTVYGTLTKGGNLEVVQMEGYTFSPEDDIPLLQARQFSSSDFESVNGPGNFNVANVQRIITEDGSASPMDPTSGSSSEGGTDTGSGSGSGSDSATGSGSPPPEEEGLGGGIIAAIIGGVIVGAVLVIWGVIALVKRRKAPGPHRRGGSASAYDNGSAFSAQNPIHEP